MVPGSDTGAPALKVSVEPKGVTQKIQARLGFLPFHPVRFFPLDGQSQPPFPLVLKEAPPWLASQFA
jgi:hypothetical protein